MLTSPKLIVPFHRARGMIPDYAGASAAAKDRTMTERLSAHRLPTRKGAYSGKRGCRDDSQARIRRVSPLLEQEGSENRTAPQPRHLHDPGSGREARARRPVLQASRLAVVPACW